MASSALDDLSNLSLFLNAPLNLSFDKLPLPSLKDDHDVLVGINFTGICGSDVHYWRCGKIGHFQLREPMVLGHESVGTILATGSAVTSLRIGDRVALEPGHPCRRCADCRAGNYNLCDDMKFAATPPYHGTLTGVFSAPADFCYRLPESVSLQEGALVEPLAVSVHAVRQADIKPGQSVAIFGAGPVGLLCAAIVKEAYGASVTVCVDVRSARLDLARDIGATHVYLARDVSPQENAASIQQLVHLPRGVDVVIDASGAQASIQTGICLLRPGGCYVQLGMGQDDCTFPIMALCLKEVTARGSFRYGPGDYDLAIQLIGSGKVPVKKLISRIVPFDQAQEAFELAAKGDLIKILIAGPNEGDVANNFSTGRAKDTRESFTIAYPAVSFKAHPPGQPPIGAAGILHDACVRYQIEYVVRRQVQPVSHASIKRASPGITQLRHSVVRPGTADQACRMAEYGAMHRAHSDEPTPPCFCDGALLALSFECPG
ncbi:hypothetical protein XA68_12647 [Ophiocordyceps unilateralis]|uniref:L-arabinitol 4-dehydrogenase n=1 Tax=Ophiocordyceps unilateralis TaxID=268505 RepID=A0A2A9PEG3_OPHUN|nr:hypothetical protein XA68_12647 [Ophiocordyceps unilateralis]